MVSGRPDRYMAVTETDMVGESVASDSIESDLRSPACPELARIAVAPHPSNEHQACSA
jgi:hypothetical protein